MLPFPSLCARWVCTLWLIRKLRHGYEAQLLVRGPGAGEWQSWLSFFSLRQVLPWALGVRLKSWWQLDIWGAGETFLIWEGLS